MYWLHRVVTTVNLKFSDREPIQGEGGGTSGTQGPIDKSTCPLL